MSYPSKQAEEVLHQGDIPRRRYRILAFDGGPGGMTYIEILHKLVAEVPEFLSKADMFAGTSNGSFLSLFLASRTKEQLRDGPAIVKELHELDNEFLGSIQGGKEKELIKRLQKRLKQLSRGFSFLMGRSPLLDNKHSKAFFEKVFGDLRVKDLHHHVAIVTLRLFSMPEQKGENPFHRPWGPHVYHNLLPCSQDPNYHEGFDPVYYGKSNARFEETKLSDLALRSSSMPLLAPVFQGHVDGAIFANQPSMAAFSLVKEMRRWINYSYNRDQTGQHKPRGSIIEPEDIFIFSLGGDDKKLGDPKLEDILHQSHAPGTTAPDSLPWGYGQWLLRIKSPLLLLKLLITSDGRGISDQCKSILSIHNQMRLAVMKDMTSADIFLQAVLTGRQKEIQEQARAMAENWSTETYGAKEFMAHLLKGIGLIAQDAEQLEAKGNKLYDESKGFFHILEKVLRDYFPKEETDAMMRNLSDILDRMGEVAVSITDESDMEKKPVYDRLKERFGPNPSSKTTMAEYLQKFIQEIFSINSSEQFTVTHSFATLWLWTTWMADVPPTFKSRAFWSIITDPYYSVPLYKYYEDNFLNTQSAGKK